MPAPERLEEIGALATLVDENRFTYGLDALCAWRGLPGKDETLLKEAAASYGLPKKVKVRAHLWQLPARYVGPYAEADAANTLALWESLYPVLDQQGTCDAYRLEVDLLPLVLEMRRQGPHRRRPPPRARARSAVAEARRRASGPVWEARRACRYGRDRPHQWWRRLSISTLSVIPDGEGRSSFTAGSTGWMHKHPHWLPQLIVKADKAHNAAVKFLENYILGHAVNGRIHAEIHPHRSDEGGTRSLRFSYSDPPQQMTAHDESWRRSSAACSCRKRARSGRSPTSASRSSGSSFTTRSSTACVRRRRLPIVTAPIPTDLHQLVADWTGIDRQSAKVANFAKAFGAGVRRFAAMIDKPEAEARTLYTKYDRELPFVSQLSALCQNTATKQGYIELYDGARRHWDNWEAPGSLGRRVWARARVRSERRVGDPNHAWHRRWIRRAETHKAMNALIQSLGRAPYQALDAGVLARGHCPALADA
jgi:hypothetical protein